MKPLIFHPDALGELHAAPTYYYEEGLLDVADELVSELNDALDQIAAQPRQWKKILENIHAFIN
jgi:hypothetical protein